MNDSAEGPGRGPATLAFLARPGWSEALAAELARTLPGSAHRAATAAWVESEIPPAERERVPTVAFARQCLPAAQPVAATSISQWADAAADWILPHLRQHDLPWRLHVFQADDPAEPVSPRRCGLIRSAILELVKDRRRKLWKRLVSEDRAHWSPGEALVQVALRTAQSGWVSVCSEAERRPLRRIVSPFPGGRVDAPDDRGAPSLAHKKLREVEIRLGRQIAAGERCVDLGGAPGGWSWVALSRGASVLAIDRSPLRADLMRHPSLTFEKRDAFAFTPAEPVDWLLCDVIAFPQRTLELLDRWLSNGLCRRFCVTVKFRGRGDDAVLEDFKRLLETRTEDFQLRQLDANRNEVTAFGTVR